MPTSNNGEEGNRQLYAKFMRATARDDAHAVKSLVDVARSEGSLDDNLLRLGLQNCAKKGHYTTAKVLLENNAKTDVTPGFKGSPALFWAIATPQNKGHLRVAQLLLDKTSGYAGCPADLEWRGEQGWSLVHDAAWRGHLEALRFLLDSGANINARDAENRTVLHVLAADTKGKWDQRTVSLLLDRAIDVNAKDDRHRTALHWACATGKAKLVEQLLSRKRLSRPTLDIPTSRGKTALQLACSLPGASTIVSMLLSADADPQIRSDGGWTCLHVSAAVQESSDITDAILSACPDLLNAQTSTGLTALHCAAEAGHEAVVRLLLSKPNIKINPKDSFYTTPLLRAAQQGYMNVVHCLAPWNNTSHLSHYAVDACNNFEATIVDFRGAGSEHNNIVQKRSVFETLYALDNNNEHIVTTKVSKIKTKGKPGDKTRPKFRWISLPANNLAWVEALIAKNFIEEDCRDIDGFKAVERAFSYQHAGPKIHSRYMNPMCQRSSRGAWAEALPLYGPLEDAIKSGAGKSRQDYQSSPERASRPPPARQIRTPTSQISPSREQETRSNEPGEGQSSTPGLLKSLVEEPETLPGSESAPTTRRDRRRRRVVATEGQSTAQLQDMPPPPSQTKSNEEVTEGSSGSKRRTTSRLDSMPASDLSTRIERSKIQQSQMHGSNITLFMPYLHWEFDGSYRLQRDAVHSAKADLTRPRCPDETLIRAFMQSSLHLRRTLDQFFFHGIDTEDRDSDQVVYRWCRDTGREERLYMVDQMWIFILGPGLIVTAFPQRWQQPKNDPLNVLDGIIEDVNSKTGFSVQSVYDLALLITSRIAGAFDRHRPGDEDFQFFDHFESSIGSVNHEETGLYRDFYQASAAVHTWLSEHKESSLSHRYPVSVDRFLDIGKETALLQEIKDIRDELGMIAMVLNSQKATLPALNDAICDDLVEIKSHSKAREVRRRVEEQKRIVDIHLAELERMAKLSQGLEASLLNLLDLKQKQSNAFEARFARDQAAGTVRQGQILLVFTMATIIFLPMSFMAAVFAIPLETFPRNQYGNVQLGTSFVLRNLLGIGIGISVFMILSAFSLNPLRVLFQSGRRLILWRGRKQPLRASRLGSQFKNHDLLRVNRFSIDSTEAKFNVEADNSIAANGAIGDNHEKHDTIFKIGQRQRQSLSLSLRRARPHQKNDQV